MSMYSANQLRSEALEFLKLKQIPVCKCDNLLTDYRKYIIMRKFVNDIQYDMADNNDYAYSSYDKLLELIGRRVEYLSDEIGNLDHFTSVGANMYIPDDVPKNICVYYSQFVTELYGLSACLGFDSSVFGLPGDFKYEFINYLPQEIFKISSYLKVKILENIENNKKSEADDLSSFLDMIFSLKKYFHLVTVYIPYIEQYFKDYNMFISICKTLLANEIYSYANLYFSNVELKAELHKYIAGQITLDDKDKPNIFPSNTSTVGDILEWCNSHAYDASIILKDFVIGERRI